MQTTKKLNRDILYKIELKVVDNCYEYCLVNANDNEDIYAILQEKELTE